MPARIRGSAIGTTNDPRPYDLIFVGGGLSCTLTLIQVLEELRTVDSGLWSGRQSRPWRFAVVDRWGDFGGGIPYGGAVHPMLLLNNDVAAMNIRKFLAWLAENRPRWLGMLQEHPSAAVKSWLVVNEAALAASEIDPQNYLPLFLPRFVFGSFIEDLLEDALSGAQDVPADVEFVRGEAVSLARLNNNFQISFKDGASLTSGIVALGLGSLPPEPAPDVEGLPGYIHNPNSPRDAQLCPILKDWTTRIAKPSRLAIVGSHASAMETIFTIAHDQALQDMIGEITVISRSGRLPDAHASDMATPFEARGLVSLVGNQDLSARQVAAAALSDAAQARRAGYSSVDYSPPLCFTFRQAFESLAASEKQCFVENFGMQFTALNRHTSPEYEMAARRLHRKGKLRLIAAEVMDIKRSRGPSPDFALGLKTARGESEGLCAAVVVNCTGSGTLAGAQIPLLQEILRLSGGIAEPNRCGRGITVSADFEASRNVFVIGPLLAGHSCGSDHLWNLENATRLDWLAHRIAPVVVARLNHASGSVCR